MYNFRAQAHLVNDGRFEVDEDGSGHMLPGPGLVEERTERVVVRTHLKDVKRIISGQKEVLRALTRKNEEN